MGDGQPYFASRYRCRGLRGGSIASILPAPIKPFMWLETALLLKPEASVSSLVEAEECVAR